MIKHIVAFSAKNPQDVPTIKEALEKMGSIPTVRHWEVSRNAKRDSLSKEMDVVIYSEFDSWPDLEAFQAHPTYQDTINIVRPLRDQRIVIDYEI